MCQIQSDADAESRFVDSLVQFCKSGNGEPPVLFFGILATLLDYCRTGRKFTLIGQIAQALGSVRCGTPPTSAEWASISAVVTALLQGDEAEDSGRIAAVRLLSALCPSDQAYLRTLTPLFRRTQSEGLRLSLEWMMAATDYPRCGCLSTEQQSKVLQWLARSLVAYSKHLQQHGENGASDEVCLVLARKTFDEIDLNLDGYRRRAMKHIMEQARLAEQAEDFALAEHHLSIALVINGSDTVLVERFVGVIVAAIEQARRQGEAEAVRRHYQKLVELEGWSAKSIRRVLRCSMAEPETEWIEILLGKILRSLATAPEVLDKSKFFVDFSQSINRLRERGRFESAKQLLDLGREVLGAEPVFDYLQSLIELRQGHSALGWKLIQARARMHIQPEALVGLPEWDGASPVPSVLVWWPEGLGIGGEIMRIVFLPMLSACAGHIGLTCDPRLHSCLRRSFPGLSVYPYNFEGFDISRYTHKIDLLSLPALFWNRIEGGLLPVLRADADKIESIAADLRAEGSFTCGFSWFAPNPRSGVRRSVLGSLFTQFIDQFPADIRCVSLQHGYSEEGAYAITPARPFLRPINPETDVEGLIATIAALDMVVTVDNSVAHLAGALGVPTVLLLATEQEVQWYAHPEKTPFYQSVRFFKQKTQGRWHEPLQETYRCVMGMRQLKWQGQTP